ncbi:MAG: SLC13 family permease [Hyphomicrobiales bacterium]
MTDVTQLQMWVTFGVIFLAVVSYVLERVSMELTSICVIVVLLLFFHFFPVTGDDGANLLGADSMLSGFANPALITIIALLVIGQGLYHTGALIRPTRRIAILGRSRPQFTLIATLVSAGIISAFMNNTPVVVIFIPVLTALAHRLHVSPSKVLIPLSFISILGGMMTIIGSSTNLLVAGIAVKSGIPEIGFFDFFIPGLVLATVGCFYVIFLAPRLLPDREALPASETGLSGKQFIAQIEVTPEHVLYGERAVAGLFPHLKQMTVRLVQRGEHVFLPPFEDVRLKTGDLVIVAATRKALTEALMAPEGILTTDLPAEEADDDGSEPAQIDASGGELTLAETVIAPASRLIGRRIGQSGLRTDTGCIVLGIQRRSRMIRGRLEEIRLEPGDTVLMLGTRSRIRALRANRDLLLMSWSAEELPDMKLATRARLIFLATITAAATGFVPIVLAALAGAAAMVPAGCLNVRQASRAFDRRIYLLIGAAIAMALALDKTGGAMFLAQGVVNAFAGASPAVILSALFLLIAVLTNFLSNNATALLFTPIAVGTARELGIDPLPFLYGVIFAANCSFAAPMGYQTNLLVMGPGHYKFSDYTRVGAPLIIILWIVYSLFAPVYFDL